MPADPAPGDGLTVIRVLGPVDVLTYAGDVAVGGRLERMLLGALAVAANHSVPTDELAQVLWGDDPPASRDNALQTYIFRLRRILGHHRISSENHSYKLHVARGDLDALDFEALVLEAMAERIDPQRRLVLCKQALGLWRGMPFGDFADQDPFRLEVLRLEELRLLAIELRLECEIVLGNEELVGGTLEALIEEYPYRERLWHLFVAALALAGRRVEALRACNNLRAVLGQVGLEPTIEILELEEAILAEDPNVRNMLKFLSDRASNPPLKVDPS